MTVQELIEELQKIPNKEKRVVIDNPNEGYDIIDGLLYNDELEYVWMLKH